ncbi:hypothetical protein BDV96DRAFT_593946 [Lophiotrema nucula]|uniref:BTB domain-containing protein n=1 Tax=Lophiotrema nucula TaxID=690887 RepID=A0A6A5ZSN6_9PLEO|nr:hypothetical protein BDV96DRAFT_593946 [Lophiotrema nucula]
MSSALILIRVNNDGETSNVHVHRALLEHHSRNLCDRIVMHNGAEHLTIEGIKTMHLELYCQSLYTSNIPIRSLPVQEQFYGLAATKRAECGTKEVCLKQAPVPRGLKSGENTGVYAVANYLDDITTKHRMMRAMITLAREVYYDIPPTPGIEAITVLYKATQMDDPACQFLVDLVAERGDTDWMTNSKEEIPPDFVRDLAVETMRVRYQFPSENVLDGDVERYFERPAEDTKMEMVIIGQHVEVAGGGDSHAFDT